MTSKPLLNKTKVLVSFHASQMGGAEIATIELIDGLKKRNIEVYATLPNQGPAAEALDKIKIPYKIIPHVSWGRDARIRKQDLKNENYVNTRAIEHLYRLIIEEKIDVVISSTITNPWAAVAASAAQKPNLWQIHEYGNLGYPMIFDYPYDQILRIINNLSEIVVVNSKAVQDHVAYMIEARKLKQIYAFKPDLKNIKADEKIFKNNKAKKIVVLGKFVESKGQLDAVKAAELLINKHKKNIQLALVGAGPLDDHDYVKSINNYIQSKKISANVSIHEFSHDPYPIIAAADIVVTPSLDEAFGRVTAEGMYLGKAVIGARSGGTKELIQDNETGLLYEPGAYEELAEKLLGLIGDSSLYNRLSTSAAAFAKNTFTEDSYSGRIAELVSSLAKKRSKDYWFYEKIIPTYVQISDDDSSKIAKLQLEIETLKSLNTKSTQELTAIKNSKGWKLLKKAYKVKNHLSN